jgi:hypothetical protein
MVDAADRERSTPNVATVMPRFISNPSPTGTVAERKKISAPGIGIGSSPTCALHSRLPSSAAVSVGFTLSDPNNPPLTTTRFLVGVWTMSATRVGVMSVATDAMVNGFEFG